jgi:tetratricopeptide (TPR) repeat protein
VKLRRRMLIAHEDGPTRLALMRSFEERDWAVQGVRTSAGVVEMLAVDKDFSTLLLSWEMPKHSAVRVLTQLGSQAAEDRPVILAFGPRWSLLELKRALQCGADGVLAEPLRPEAVEADLDAWSKTGETRSRKALLDQHAALLLEPDDAVWAWDDDENWRGEMQSLSSAVREGLRRSRGLTTEGEPMDASYLRTLVDLGSQAAGNQDDRRLRALINEEAWNGALDDVTRRRLAPLLGRKDPEAVRVDLEHLRAMFGADLQGLQGLDVEKLRGLLNRTVAKDHLDQETLDRLRGLRNREMGWVVDYVWLLQMRTRFGRVGGGEGEVDTDRLKGLRREEAETDALSSEESMRLQLTMAMMFRVRNDEDRGRLVDRLRSSHGQDGRTALMLKGILQSMGEERTLRMLREKLGVSSDGATPGDVSRLLGKNDLDPAIFGVAEVADENPDAVALLNELGMRLRRAKRWDDAAHHYERALEIMPREPGLLFNFARLKLDLGFVDDAEALLDRMDAESQTQTAVHTLRVAIARSRTSDGAGA